MKMLSDHDNIILPVQTHPCFEIRYMPPNLELILEREKSICIGHFKVNKIRTCLAFMSAHFYSLFMCWDLTVHLNTCSQNEALSFEAALQTKYSYIEVLEPRESSSVPIASGGRTHFHLPPVATKVLRSSSVHIRSADLY